MSHVVVPSHVGVPVHVWNPSHVTVPKQVGNPCIVGRESASVGLTTGDFADAPPIRKLEIDSERLYSKRGLRSGSFRAPHASAVSPIKVIKPATIRRRRKRPPCAMTHLPRSSFLCCQRHAHSAGGRAASARRT